MYGKTIEDKENEEIKLFKEDKLVKGTKKIPALFEEADGLWFNLQGKDRKEQIEKYKKKCEKEGKEFNPRHKCKTEVKLHVMYEGWNKNSERHELINKKYIAGMMTSQRLKKLKNARIHQEYDIESIQLRALNGDGASWINNIATEDTICQKDNFHIQQEIVRDIQDKKYRQELIKMLENKKYTEIHDYIENLKYASGGEEKVVKKLNTLQSYLATGLARYQDILAEKGKELPEAPERYRIPQHGNNGKPDFHSIESKIMQWKKSFFKARS